MNTKTTKTTSIEPGDRVIVCDGTPRPPKHHTRKLSRWRSKNFAGTVREISFGSVYVLHEAASSRHVKVIQGCQPAHVFPADQAPPEILERIEVQP